MFSADLSWTDNTTEKVGQRRQRRANKRENSISSSTSGSKKDFKDNEYQRKPSLGSITKTISFSSVKDSMRRPSTATSAQLKSPSMTVTESVAHHREYKDPAYQPDYIYSAKLGPRLPSGAIIGSPRSQHAPSTSTLPARTVYSQPHAIWEESASELDASPAIAVTQHRAWSVKTQVEAENICQSYEQVKDEILALQNPDSILPRPDLAASTCDLLPTYPRDEESITGHQIVSPSYGENDVVPYDRVSAVFQIEEETPRTKYVLPVSGVESKLELPPIFRPAASTDERRQKAHGTPPQSTSQDQGSDIKVSQWSAPENWDIVKSQVEIRKILDSESSNDDLLDERRQSMFVGSHFQRFVRRMESAGPRIILERLKEEWDLPGDRAMSDELQLEKHLWALTAMQLPSMDRFARQVQSDLPSHPLPPITPKRRRKILEIDGSIGEIYQLSAIYPNSRIYHLTKTAGGNSIPLPSQAVQHEINIGNSTEILANRPLSTAVGVLPLPYANTSMHHIRSTRVSTLLAGSQLPLLLAECYRVLKPGGVLELRLIDATPERRSMGPLLANWLEDRLLLSLEADFKCTRPVMLIPRWARDAGFVPISTHAIDGREAPDAEAQKWNQGLTKCLRLPAVASNPHSTQRDIVGQVGVLVSRALWKDAWGAYVCDSYEEHWWWENPDIVDECREYNTTFDVGILIVMKSI